MESEINRRHNEMVLRDLEEGDLVEFPRGIFSHWGVYVGTCKELVVHLAMLGGSSDSKFSSNPFTYSGGRGATACVKLDNFWDIAKDSKAKKNNSKDMIYKPFSQEEIKSRALSMIGTIRYSVLSSNCEHFASWCRNDIMRSEQAEDLKLLRSAAAAIGGAAVIIGGVAVVIGGIVSALLSGDKNED